MALVTSGGSGPVVVVAWTSVSPTLIPMAAMMGSLGGSLLSSTVQSRLSVPTTPDPRNQTLCDEWVDNGQLLFQSANFCFAAAFLVPHRFRLSVLVMRVLLSAGFLTVTLWAGANVCTPDIFAWNLTLLVTNCAHTVILLFRHVPPRLKPELQDLFEKVFLPLKLEKKDFKELVKEADILGLDDDDHYAMEGITPADERLSILISGRLRATCENVLLHYIQPNEFIDSPEYEACPVGSDKLFQVTITGEVPCRYLCWPRRRLQVILKTNKLLEAVLYNLLGKDITHKLYSLNEFHRLEVKRRSNEGSEANSTSDWWRSQIPRSLSVDAVHTGTKGRVRSQMWRGGRRDSANPSDSLGSSPARSRPFAHSSDPGPRVSQFPKSRPLVTRDPKDVMIRVANDIIVAIAKEVDVCLETPKPVRSTKLKSSSVHSIQTSAHALVVLNPQVIEVNDTDQQTHVTFETSV